MQPSRRLVHAALAAALAAAGCQARVTGSVAPAGPQASRAPGKAAATPSAKPTGTRSAAPAAKAPILRLQAPAGAHLQVAGQLKLDASWLVAAGAGNLRRRGDAPLVAAGPLGLIGNDGSTLIGNDGSTLIGNDGSTLIGNDGSTLIGNDGSTLIGNDGSTLIGNDGSTLIGNDGSTLIGNDGSTLIGNDGSTMVAAGAGNAVAPPDLAPVRSFGLLQAASPSARPSFTPVACVEPVVKAGADGLRVAFGAELPAAVMKLGLVGLADGQPLPLGRTDGDQPVTAVYSDVEGRFKLYLPPGKTDYVRLTARPPNATDPALAFEFLVDPLTGQVAADEDRAVVTSYLRAAFRTRMDVFLSGDPDAVAAGLETPGSTEFSKDSGRYLLIKGQIEGFTEVAKRRRLNKLPAAERFAIAQRAADTLLAGCDFDKLKSNHPNNLWTYKSEKRPLDEMVASFRAIRCHTVARMAKVVAQGRKPETAFADIPEIAAARRPDGSPWVIRRPTDFANFLVATYLLPPNGRPEEIGPTAENLRFHAMLAFLDRLGMLTQEDADGRTMAAGYAVVLHMFTVFFFDDGRPVVGAEEYTGTRGRIGDAVFAVFETAPEGPPE